MESGFGQPYDDVESFLAKKELLDRAAASAVDHYSRRDEFIAGVPEFNTYWFTMGHYYALKARASVRPIDLWSEPSRTLIDWEYTIFESPFHPVPAQASYWFSTTTGQVCVADSDNEPVPNQSPDENIAHLDAVFEILQSRPGKVPLDSDMIELELSFHLADEETADYLRRLRGIGRHVADRSARQERLTKNIVSTVMSQKPFFSERVLTDYLADQVGADRQAA